MGTRALYLMTVPIQVPSFEILKLGKITESNTVASLLMTHIFSISSPKMKWEMQIVELFDFVRLYTHFF